jgi:hypothetical protein
MIALAVFALSSTAAGASDIYVAQAASGANTGIDCANAYALTFFNSSSNWGSGAGQIGPGATVHLCGTFSSTAKAQGSGSSGSPITIRFEAGANFTAPTWGGSYALGSDSALSYLVIDGGSNGLIQTTDNGTSLDYQNNDIGISFSSAASCQNCEIKNMAVGPMYVRTGTVDQGGQGSTGIDVWQSSNVSIHNNTLHDAKVMIGVQYAAGTSGIQVYSNTAYNCDHGVAIGGQHANATLANAVVHDNTIHDFVMWDDTSPNSSNHHDGVHVWADGAAGSNIQINGLQVYNNYIYGDFGATATAGIYVEEEGGSGEVITGTEVFNNVVNNSSAHAPCCGLIYIKGMDAGGQPNPQVYNNTLVDGTNSSNTAQFQGAGVTGALFKNNILSQGAIMVDVNDGAALASGGSNNNAFQSGANFIYNNGWISYASWQTNAGGIDAGSTTGNPYLSGSFTLQGLSSAVGLGANLTPLGITALDSDKAGAPRPPTGAWDAGAYRFAGPVAPTGLSVIVH